MPDPLYKKGQFYKGINIGKKASSWSVSCNSFVKFLSKNSHQSGLSEPLMRQSQQKSSVFLACLNV